MGLGKNAIYFATDALFAAMLILGGFLFIYQMTTTEHPTEHIDYLSKDLLVALDTIPLSAINHTFIQQEVANGNITDLDRTVLEQVAEYWAREEDAKAQNLTAIILADVIPPSLGARLRMRSDVLYEQLHDMNIGIIASRRMISGIDEGKPLHGSSSYGYLRSIKDKRFSAYAYFGGFVGQGNITVKLEPLPDDVNESRIRRIALEADLERTVTVRINGDHCDNLTPVEGNFTAGRWNLTACKGLLMTGTNNVTLAFPDLNDAFVGGGYLRVDYETDYFQTNKSYAVTTYAFPRIEGIINLYDAIHVPGELQSMTVELDYLANHTNTTNNTLYLTIGNTTVYADTNSTDAV
ncbi:hypothetical protein GF367_03895, partial [Candidatus Woesearchaeota archaeon]|nr:hypothetical protein [Candidatus Woesearchaeota archaeon]